MGFSITSAVFGGLIITFYSIAINSNSYKDYYDSYYLVDYIAINSRSYKDYYDSYYLAYEAELSITGIILFIGILEFLLGIWAAICCCVMKVCACCNIHAQSQQVSLLQGRLSTRSLTQTAVLCKQWALGIFYRNVQLNWIHVRPFTICFWPSQWSNCSDKRFG